MQLTRLVQIGVVAGALAVGGTAVSANVDLPATASAIARDHVATVVTHAQASAQPTDKAEATKDADVDKTTADADKDANSAKPSGTSRPGWGCGDTNHTHTGPAGNTTAKSPCSK